ncbi:helix-turn-helix domain-containing protein [Tenacibaculum maritimum]|uniref:helix-turn-helix domain-containing protein n=1 Tax=Tenacibaculum maritimum TaxID=107401 RepID=UPI000416F31D|nr:helix-turn-helix transcriptional regulator [Tenacibaculum maritimum]
MTDKEKLQLAGACNFEKSNMARLEAGKTNPTLYTLQKIAENLDVKLSFLIDID